MKSLDEVLGVKDIATKARTESELSLASLKVISTLWKHQQQYYKHETQKGRWSFTVGHSNPNYQDYMLGVFETMALGLVAIASNGQTILTDAGVEYCKEHQDLLLPDWNFNRWKQPDAMTWNSSNFIGLDFQVEMDRKSKTTPITTQHVSSRGGKALRKKLPSTDSAVHRIPLITSVSRIISKTLSEFMRNGSKGAMGSTVPIFGL